MLITVIVIVLIAGAVVLWYFNRDSKSLDVNADGKVDVADAKVAVEKAVEGVKAAADANKDGKVDAKDAEVVVEKAKTEVKKAATKAKETVKKAAARGRKPKAQK